VAARACWRASQGAVERRSADRSLCGANSHLGRAFDKKRDRPDYEEPLSGCVMRSPAINGFWLNGGIVVGS
jgi:hypothetical protein